MPAWPGFIGGSGTTQSLIFDGESTINYYVEERQGDPRAVGGRGLFPSPGFAKWTTVSDVGGRAALVANGRFFMVLGGGLYEFDLNGIPTKRGTVTQDSYPAQIIYNGVVGGQLGIASGGNFYCYDLTTNTLTTVLSGEANQIGFAAGFGLAFNLTNGKVRLSNPDDLSTWDAGTFFQRSLFADPYQAMFVDANNLVWLIGTDTFEVRYNSGVGTQPFVPLSGLVGAYGIAAPFAFASTGAGNFWLTRNPQGVGQFVATRGGAPQAISTYAFSTAVASYLRNGGISDAEVLAYQQEGHTFLAISFSAAQAQSATAPTTWVVDADTQSWTQRGRWTGARWESWAPRVHAYAFNQHLIGDRVTGQVSTMDTTLTTEIDGTGIVRERTAALLTTEHQRQPIDQLELLMDVGLGTASGAGADPTATLRISVDGGRTYGNERRAGFGRIGEYQRRVYWTRLGAPASAVAKVRVTDPVPSRIVNAWINNAEGNVSGRAA